MFLINAIYRNTIFKIHIFNFLNIYFILFIPFFFLNVGPSDNGEHNANHKGAVFDYIRSYSCLF